MKYSSFIGAAAFFSTPAFANLGRATLWGSGISPLIDPSLWANLHAPKSTADQWAAGIIPQRCYQEVSNLGYRPEDVEVFNVHYADCGSPWSFCRHISASLSQADMIDLFGRLPVHEREWIQHVIAVPGGGSAYESIAVIVFQGPVGVPSVFQHETTHALDAYLDGTQVSESFYWLNSIYADTCVPDSYSNTNEVEDFAQVGVVGLFAAVNPGGMDPAFGDTWHCLLNQFNTWNGFIGTTVNPGGTCDRRWADSPVVSNTNGTAVKRDVVMPKILTADMPGVEAIPFEHHSGVTHYTNLSFNETEKTNAELQQDAWAKAAQKTKKRSERMERFEEKA